ncbi:MAG: hypothetical protein HY725_13885 [Candidatus Rokubacteria bacterium]|nr:hypothetical protein [Candidatus Rokubacteria bacterium]
MIFLVEFLEDDGALSQRPPRVDVEADERRVVEWLAARGRQAYVRQLFTPYGFLWVPQGRSPREGL